VGGQADLSAKLIRTIGDPHRRFAEDHLRMLRAVRFAARFGFDIHAGTLKAIQERASSLGEISAERIWMELELILSSPTRTAGWALLRKTGLRGHVSKNWPEVQDRDGVAATRLAEMQDGEWDVALPLAAVLCDWETAVVSAVCRDLRLSNRSTKAVAWLLRSRRMASNVSTLELADVKQLMAGAHWPELLELARIDGLARGIGSANYDELARRALAVPGDRVAPQPLLGGDNLTASGVSPGPRLGKILDAVYRAQLNETVVNQAEALALAQRMLAEDEQA
jgi:tRNA nucleotidyltransferase/poly(A) polymerase